MSKKYNDCDIVLELLPLYLDQKTGEESNAFVREHLAGCADCREVHRLMSADLSEGKVAASSQIEKEGKRKRRQLSPARKRTMIVIAGLIGYLCLVVGSVAVTVWFLVY